MFLRRNGHLLATVCLSVLLILPFFMNGCSGGSQTSGVSQIDNAGITSTIGGFMQSVQAGNPEVFFSPRMKELSSTAGGVHTLEVWDFGADINSSLDNSSHTFTIPADGINQITDDFAKVYAVKSFADRQLRIDFELVKIDSQWYIEAIQFSASSLGYVTAANLLPLQKNNEWRSIRIPASYPSTLFEPALVVANISGDPVTIGAHSVYTVGYSPQSSTYNFNLSNYSSTLTALKTTDSWPILRALFTTSTPLTGQPVSIKASILDLFTQPSGLTQIGYANQLGLYQFGTTNFNSGLPIKILSAVSVIGEVASTTVNVQWSDGSTYQVFLATRLARKVAISTFAGSYDAYQLDSYARFVSAVPSGQDQEMYGTRLFAENVGEVAQIEWDQNATALHIHLLYSASVNGTTIAPTDSGTTPTTSSLVIVGASTLGDATQGLTYTQPLASGGATPYNHSVVSGALPAGMTISGGTLVGTPSAAGSFSFTVEFTDANSQTVSGTFSLVVNPGATSALAFVATTDLPMAVEGRTYSFSLALGGTPPYTFTVATSSLPVGLSFSSAGLTGTPSSAGAYVFGLTLTDAAGATVAKSFTMTVNAALQSISTTPLPAGTVGKPYSMPLLSGGVPPYSFTTSSGSLPPGVSFSANGIAGTPTTAGSYTFSIQGTDAQNFTVGHTNTISIAPPLVINVASTLPAAVVNTPYDQHLVIGGQPPYVTTVVSGTLPTGIIADPTGLSGTTTAAPGNYTVDLSVLDSLGNVATGTFVLPVSPAPAVSMAWQTLLGSSTGTGIDTEAARKIITTADGGFLIVGYVQGSGKTVAAYNGGGADFWVVKLDSAGQFQWQKNYGGSGTDHAYGAVQTSDGNYVIAGWTNSPVSGDITVAKGGEDVWMIKIDANGGLLWEKSYGGSKDERGWGLAYSSSLGLYLTGYTNSTDGDVTGFHGTSNESDMWVINIDDANGNITWNKAYGGLQRDQGYDIVFTPAFEIVVVGASASTDGDRATGAIAGNGIGVTDFWTVKLDSSGTIIWQVSNGGTSSDFARSVRHTSDGGFIISGDTSSSNGEVTGYHSGTDFWVIKVSAAGVLQWQKALGGTFAEEGFGVELTPDGGCIVAGSTGSTDGDIVGSLGNWDAWITKLDATGNLVWQRPSGGASSEKFHSVILTTGGFVVAGVTNSTTNDLSGVKTDTDYDWWIAKFQ